MAKVRTKTLVVQFAQEFGSIFNRPDIELSIVEREGAISLEGGFLGVEVRFGLSGVIDLKPGRAIDVIFSLTRIDFAEFMSLFMPSVDASVSGPLSMVMMGERIDGRRVGEYPLDADIRVSAQRFVSDLSAHVLSKLHSISEVSYLEDLCRARLDRELWRKMAMEGRCLPKPNWLPPKAALAAILLFERKDFSLIGSLLSEETKRMELVRNDPNWWAFMGMSPQYSAEEYIDVLSKLTDFCNENRT